MLRSVDKDFRHLKMPEDSELNFSLGFTTALVLIAGVLKLTGVIQ